MNWPRRVSLAFLAAMLGALMATASALAGNAVTTPGGSTSISLAAVAEPAVFDKPFAVEGTLSPPVAGVEVAVARVDGAGKPLGTALTAADGSFSITLSLKRPVSLVAAAASLGLTSNQIDVVMKPKLTLRVGKVAAFTNVKARLTVQPTSATGVARITVKQKGAPAQTTRTRIRNGRATETIVAPGPGGYTVLAELDPGGYAKATTKTTAKATSRQLRVGSSGADVAGLIRKLRSLNLHVPATGRTFTSSLTDSVIAFQKITGRARTGAITKDDWRALAKARPVQATRRGPPNRIEVDKTRQVLIKVRGGKVAGVLPVSTGATGNTPEGVHEIRWKAPSTTTWLGPGILYRTLTFFGNAFAIHGWSSVPAYPASHGCVRVPLWTADWLYDRSPVGETVIVHR